MTAVIQRCAGADTTEEELVLYCKEQLAGYKVPRAVVFVDGVQRSPVGKADYTWAKATAIRETT